MLPIFTLNRDFQLDDIFAQREVEVALALKEFADAYEGPQRRDLHHAIDHGVKSLASIALALESYPSLRDKGTLGRRERSGETLMLKLLAAGEHGMEWSLPTKALLSRTFGIAKVNFWTAMNYAVQACTDGEDHPLLADIEGSIEEAVYTRLAEELYGSFVTTKTTPRPIRLAAVQAGIDLWEGRVRFATHRFCPILRSAWAARCRAPRTFGTMMGATEMFQLIFEDCDPKFVESFMSSEADSETTQAFEEFLFDISFEGLELVRLRMKEDGKACVGEDDVARYLGLPHGLRPMVNAPKAVYSSFRTRRVKAQYRTSTGAPGPKRVAESYMLETLLREQLERDAAK